MQVNLGDDKSWTNHFISSVLATKFSLQWSVLRSCPGEQVGFMGSTRFGMKVPLTVTCFEFCFSRQLYCLCACKYLYAYILCTSTYVCVCVCFIWHTWNAYKNIILFIKKYISIWIYKDINGNFHPLISWTYSFSVRITRKAFSGIQPCPLTVTETHPAISSAAGPRREVLVDLERSPYRYYW